MADLVDRDQEHLRLLQWAYYLQAGVTGFFSLFAILYMVIGAVLFSAMPANGADNPRQAGMIFAIFGGALLALGFAITVLTWLTGLYLKQRRRRLFCLIFAGFTCAWVPYGTALGVCTIMVLCRPAVRELFEPSQTVVPVQQ